MAEILNIIAKTRLQSGCNIESITISCIINSTIGIILFSIDKNYIISSLIAYFPATTIAVNRYLSLNNNSITEFQLASTTIDIGLHMVLLIAVPKNNKRLLAIIKD